MRRPGFGSDGRPVLQIKLLAGIEHAPAEAWDRCAGAANPFVGHAFLRTLEASGSAVAETGWAPAHLALEDEDGGLLRGAVPVYAKSHSWGEYVFDHSWADAYQRAGGRYYPKLQVAVPFTPVPGPRLLVPEGPDAETDRGHLIAGLEVVCERLEASSVHATFCAGADAAAFERAGWLIRHGMQYHWKNRGYRDFDDFLDTLRSSKRKTIRKERRAVVEQGVEIEVLTGDALTERHWRAFWPFYLATVDKRWGSAYLTEGFFQRLGRELADRVVLVMAKQGGRYVGGALNLLGADTLYGRNWGCLDDFRFLHFEACYYAAIEFAIARGLASVEAGAQGEHKLQRGYEPVRTSSAHHIRHDGLKAAIGRFLESERRQVDCALADLRGALPFRNDRPA